MDLRVISPVLGAEVFGIDLNREVDGQTFDLVHQAFLDHGVLVFRRQDRLRPEAQIAFARRFGPLHTHPAAPADGSNEAIFVIHAHRDSRVANGNGWHSDVSCDPEPPKATMLQIQQLPEGGGGDTLFASMEAAWATLPESWRSRLRTLSANHESEHIYRGRYADRGVDDSQSVYPSSTHPVVRTHPKPDVRVSTSTARSPPL